jgi:hypothetical protein
MRRKMFADALLIQPVVLSRGTVMPTMGIECSGAAEEGADGGVAKVWRVFRGCWRLMAG